MHILMQEKITNLYVTHSFDFLSANTKMMIKDLIFYHILYLVCHFSMSRLFFSYVSREQEIGREMEIEINIVMICFVYHLRKDADIYGEHIRDQKFHSSARIYE